MNSAIWEDYRKELIHFVRSKVSNQTTAEDIVQEVLLKINRELSTLKDKEKLLPWMYSITRNEITTYYRRKKDLLDIDTLHISGEKEEESTAQKELAQCLRPMINALPEKYREALTLSELEGVPQREVGQSLGLSTSGAKSRVQRGREILRRQLTENCHLIMDAKGSIMDYQCQCKVC